MSDLLGIIDRLREAAAAMLVPIDHRSHENSSWPSSECDDCMSIRKVRADRLRAALSDSTPSAPTLDVERLIDLFIGYAVNAVDGVDPGPWQRTRRVLGHVRTEFRDPLFKARLQDAARLSEVQSDDR